MGLLTYGFIPTISRSKWLEFRHMATICNRWAHNHMDNLPVALFSGIGCESWGNTWGMWNRLTRRDVCAVCRAAMIEPVYSGLLVRPGSESHAQAVHFGVFANKWQDPMNTLRTVVSRKRYQVVGEQLRVSAEKGVRYFDLRHGTEILPKHNGNEAGCIVRLRQTSMRPFERR